MDLPQQLIRTSSKASPPDDVDFGNTKISMALVHSLKSHQMETAADKKTRSIYFHIQQLEAPNLYMGGIHGVMKTTCSIVHDLPQSEWTIRT